MTTQPHQRSVTWVIGLPLILAVLIAFWTFRQSILSEAGAWLDVGQLPVRTDYVLVLPGGPDTRPYAAAALVKTGFADEVILLKCRITPDDVLSGYPPSHEVEQRVLRFRGVPEDRIRVLETATMSTFSDAEALRSILAERPGKTAAVVTNDYHTRRARFAFGRVFCSHLPELRFVSAPSDRFSPHDWWRHRAGLVTYLGEYLKLTFYFFRYGHGIVWTVVIGTIILGTRVLCRIWGQYGKQRRPSA